MSEQEVELPESPVTPEVPAENDKIVQNPTEQASEADKEAKADESEKKEDEPTPEQAAKREGRRFERKLSNAIRREAEAKARAEILQQELERYRQGQQPAADPSAPKLEDFSDIEDFRKAVEKHAFERGLKESEVKRQQEATKQQEAQLVSAWDRKIDAAAAKYEDFDEKVGELKPNTPWAYAVMEADNGADIAYYLGTHLDEARQIAALPPASQIRAIGRLEAKLAAEPPKQVTPSKAPAPIKPVGGKSGGANDLPSDSDDIKTWMKKEEARVRRLNGG